MNSVNIYIEANPNPNSLKFVTDRMLLQNNEIKDYPDPKSAIESPICLLYTSPSPRDQRGSGVAAGG